jgi:hypothetical protein
LAGTPLRNHPTRKEGAGQMSAGCAKVGIIHFPQTIRHFKERASFEGRG